MIEKRYEPPIAADFRHLWVQRLPRYRTLGNGRHDYERGKTGPQKIKGMRCQHSAAMQGILRRRNNYFVSIGLIRKKREDRIQRRKMWSLTEHPS
jgi:hypothetical protein